MAKKENIYKEGNTIKIIIGDISDLPFIDQQHEEETHEYITPKIPHKTDILFSELPKKEQMWKRPQYPQSFYDYVPGIRPAIDKEDLPNYKQLYPVEYKDGILPIIIGSEEYNEIVDSMIIDKERRKFGLWFYNNGVPTYITGDNYFFLTWCDMLKGDADSSGHSYPNYRRFQRDFFYFLDLCIKDENCMGGYIAKSKKVGATQMLASFFANQGTLYEKIRLGVMSKTGDECTKTNMAMIKNIIHNMPQAILPKIGKESVSEIEFSHPPNKPTGTKQYKEKIQGQKEERVLNSTIESVVTKIGAFDGAFYRFIWWDESSKYHQTVKISIKEEFDKDSASIKLQQQIKGKCWLTAYNPEVEDKGFMEARDIFYNSLKKTIDPNSLLKRTKSGLYCYHISSLYATEGTFSEYGEADTHKAFALNDDERKRAGEDINKLQALIRQGSRTMAEAWNLGGGGGSVFNNMELQISLNDNERKDMFGKIYYRRGNLKWSGQRYRSTVIFVDDPNGKWYLTRMLPENMINRFYIPQDGLNLIPYNEILFCGGIDPFEYKYVDDDGNIGRSKGASYTLATQNLVMDEYVRRTDKNDVFSKRIISFYSERPSDPEVFVEDMILETLYFGKKVLIEENKSTIVTMFKKLGLINFLLFQNNDTGNIERYNPNKNQKQKSTQTGTIEEICSAIDSYFIKREGTPDYCFMIEDSALLSQLMSFDPTKTKKFDKVMAFGYSLMALNSFNMINKVSNNSGVDMRSACAALMQ